MPCAHVRYWNYFDFYAEALLSRCTFTAPTDTPKHTQAHPLPRTHTHSHAPTPLCSSDSEQWGSRNSLLCAKLLSAIVQHQPYNRTSFLEHTVFPFFRRYLDSGPPDNSTRWGCLF